MQVQMFYPNCTCSAMRNFNACTNVILRVCRCRCFFSTVSVVPCDISMYALMSSCRDAGAEVLSELYVCCPATYKRMHWCHLVGKEVQMLLQYCMCAAIWHINACTVSSCRDAGANVPSTLYMCCHATFKRMLWCHLVGMQVQMLLQHYTCAAMKYFSACTDVIL
jgi:hypothetical protein